MTTQFAVNELPEKGKDQATEKNVQTTGTPQSTSCCDSSCCGGKKPAGMRVTI
ncbi:MAG TPA: hypothetical protein VGB10_02485 [Bacteroidota bacterium]